MVLNAVRSALGAKETPLEAAVRTLTTGRRWRIGQDSGEVFADGEDFDGITLTVELTKDEVVTLASAALGKGDPAPEGGAV
jgi:hypothetical protein